MELSIRGKKSMELQEQISSKLEMETARLGYK